ncbi:Uncharacterised protein [uncultured archaeon]|nr:Uncharacterised protein [uncultured archaeon]
MNGKYKIVMIKVFDGTYEKLNKRTTSRILYGDKVCFVCEKCKKQSIGDDTGCYEDCNNCNLISDFYDTHIYCRNYTEVEE